MTFLKRGVFVEIEYDQVPCDSNYEWVPGVYEGIILTADAVNKRKSCKQRILDKSIMAPVRVRKGLQPV